MNTKAPVTLIGSRVTLRQVAPSDASRLLEILLDPSVAEWWGDWNPERVQREMIAIEDGAVFVVEAEGAVVGLVQYGEEADPDYRHASIDIALHSDGQGRGLGGDTLRTLALHLFDDIGHHRITIDPAVENLRAIRAYERVGFKAVGVMRQYEQSPDGSWHDGLLMDMLRDDLTD